MKTRLVDCVGEVSFVLRFRTSLCFFFFLYDVLVGLGGGTICRCCAEGDVHLRFVAEVSSRVFLDLEARRFRWEPLFVRRHLCNCLLHGWKALLVSALLLLCLFVLRWNPFRRRLALEAAGFLRVFLGLKKKKRRAKKAQGISTVQNRLIQ